MKVLLVGLSHHTAPLEVRERFARDAEDGAGMLRTLLNYTRHGVVVATCNRTEIYTTVLNTDVGTQHLRRFLSEYSQLPLSRLDGYVFSASHEDAARHLFRVAAGLDSMIVGEEQILGQVRDAMEAARAMDGLSLTLSALFRHALRAGKAARSQTAISRGTVSVSSAAVSMARQFFGDLRRATVLVISAGEAGELTARALAEQGAGRILVTSRTNENAARLALALGGEPVPFARLAATLRDADIVVSSTAAPSYVLTHDLVRQAMAGRGERPLFIVDIAVPRDVEPSVQEIPGVALRNIDDLQRMTEANMDGRRTEVAKVEQIVEHEVAAFTGWWNRRDVIPTVAALHNRAEAIRQAELEKTLARLRHLSGDDLQRIEAMTHAMMKKLLHAPLMRLKAGGADTGYIEAVRELFGLHVPSADPPDAEAEPHAGTEAEQAEGVLA